jgi:hypothetical protein
MRDYTDFMAMTPDELAAYARDVAGNDLVLALAHQLETETAEAVQAARLREELEEAEARATMWQEECRALQRQMDRTYG